MQNGEHDASDTGLASGSHPEDTSNKPQIDEKTARRMEKLERLRIDPSSIEFPEGALVFEGGYAMVSQALLYSPSDDSNDRVVESRAGNVKPSDRIANLEGDNIGREAEGSDDNADDIENEGREQRSDSETSGPRKAVAVKKMKVKAPDELLRVLGLALREAEVLANLSHENIIKLEGFVEDVSKGVIWLVSPWEDNGNLKDFVALYNWEVPERVSLIYDVAIGVEYLHTRTPPICHADLKSVNILVNSQCRAVITDFGSAHHPLTNSHNREREGAIEQPQPVPPIEVTFCASTNTFTLTGIQCTTRWAAPEVLENEEFSLASDIWALGWVAYEVMTNSIPFSDVRETMAIKRIIRGDLPSIDCNVRMLWIRELYSILMLCWNIDSSKRPTAKNCRQSIGWMPMILPSLVRAEDGTLLVGTSAELLMELGQMCLRQSAYADASKCYVKALDVYIEKADRMGEGDALLQLAQIHRFQQQYSEAITLFKRAQEIFTGLGDEHGRGFALCGVAHVHRTRGEDSQAVTFYSESLQIWTDIGDRRGRADALWGLAEMHRFRKEYSQAVTLYSECLQICTDIGNREGTASALWGLAQVDWVEHQYNQAITLLSECLKIRVDQGDRRGIADALFRLAEMYQALKENAGAICRFSDALTAFTNLHDRRGRANALLGLASVYHSQKEYDHAVKFYSECLKDWPDMDDKRGRINVLCGLAAVHQHRKEYDQAITCLTEAFTAYAELDDKYWSAWTLQEMAFVYLDQGHDSEAIRHYEQAAELYKQNGNSEDESRARKQVASFRQSLEQQGAT